MQVQPLALALVFGLIWASPTVKISSKISCIGCKRRTRALLQHLELHGEILTDVPFEDQKVPVVDFPIAGLRPGMEDAYTMIKNFKIGEKSDSPAVFLAL